ncbi:hypothetical protein F5Y19DRAFT_442325 [Xylariaceae sp. FL1651]|nr:hypothetical protein F5Y19DRAFT_442325 [Xylariaceae sp. FL1651]
MSKLPIKVQVGIRDSWSNKDAPVQKAIENLKELIGVRVVIEPEWHLLLAELDAFYLDKSTLVPSVAAIVVSCCTGISTLADDEANSEWADTLIEKTDGCIRFFLEVSKNRELVISWSGQRKGFILAVPKGPAPSPSYMLSYFKGSLLGCFDEKAKSSASLNTAPAAVDDWADVSVDNTGKAAVIELPQRHQVAPVSPEPEFMPDISVLSRPDELLLKPPYHLIVYGIGKTQVEVQCSHSPTLQFLSDYLQKWSRIDHNKTTRPPSAEVKLHQSAFGLGLIYDRLTITSDARYSVQTVSPTIILALIEGVLGYKSVSADGSSWTFRRDIEFKSSRY